jgi:hypothetical protein
LFQEKNKKGEKIMYYLVVDESTGEHYVIGGPTYKEAVDMLFDDILDPDETDVCWERDYASKEEAKEDANKNHYEICDFNYDEE